MAEVQVPASEDSKSMPRKTAAVLARLKPNWNVLGPLAAATILMLLAFFLIWQSSLVYSESGSYDASQDARQRMIASMGKQITDITEHAQTVVQSDPVIAALSDASDESLLAARDVARAAWPEAADITFYSPRLMEVLRQDLARFGYGRAQMLMQAQSKDAPAPAQIRSGANRAQHLVLALPVMVENEAVAYAYAETSAGPILEILHQSNGTRLDLRQGDGRGDVIIARTRDAQGTSETDLGLPIAGSQLRLAITESDSMIVVTRNMWVLFPLTLLCLLAGFAALWLRQVGMQRASAMFRPGSKSDFEEITLADAMKQQSEAAVATPAQRSDKSAASPVAKKAEEKPMSVDRSIFRAYDIRGVLGHTLNAGVARLIGRAIGSEAQHRGLREVVVGRDGRLSGPELSGALIEGLREAGCDVIDIGLAPTPLTYFGAYHLQAGSCVSVTGSHNPPDYNGFKIVLGGETLSEGAIQDLYARIAESRFSSGSGGLQVIDVSHDYITRITDDIQVENPLKIVVDCGNGVAGAIAPAVLEGIGCEVIQLYCDIDGQFPNHHPDPSDLHNLQDLILAVKQTGADLGLAFDGDGDRLGVVTRTGEVIFPDRLLMLFAIDVLSRNPGATIIYDVKCTGHLQPVILQNGGSPIMWRTGHSLIKAKMRETGAQLAGEMSGHFFFAERWYGFDDGIYSAARLLEILASDLDGRTPEQIFASLPKGVSTPELKIELREGEHYRFIEAFKAQSSFEGARLTTIDGVRADWSDGWGLVRASNTTPVLVLRFDADNEAALQRIQNLFREQLLAVDRSLSLPF